MNRPGSNYAAYHVEELRGCISTADMRQAAFRRSRGNVGLAIQMRDQIDATGLPPEIKKSELAKVDRVLSQAINRMRADSIALAEALQPVGELQDELFQTAEDEEDWHQ